MPSKKFETDEITNPRKALKRREADAEAEDTGDAAAPVPLMKRAQDAASAPADGSPRFGKGFTPEERAEQARKLQEMLRRRR